MEFNNAIHFSDSLPSSKRGSVMGMGREARSIFLSDENRSIHDANFAFLSTTLAKLHTKVYKPKVFFTYMNDIPINTGGGFVDYVEFYSVDWAGIMNDTRNIFGNNGNIIPRVNASMTQNRVPVFTYEIGFDLRFVELEKMKKVKLADSIENIYKDAIMAGFDYFTQRIAYLGINDQKGLFNHPNVLVNTIPNSDTTGQGFQGLSDTAVVSFFNGLFERYLSESNMNISLLPDTILVPTFVNSDLVSRFSAFYSDTLLNFLKKHNLGQAQSGENFKLTIEGRPDLNDLGTFGKGRIVAYRKEEDYVRLDMPYPCQHFITLPNVEKMAYTSVFVGQVSVIQLPYNSDDTSLGIVTYWDFTN